MSGMREGAFALVDRSIEDTAAIMTLLRAIPESFSAGQFTTEAGSFFRAEQIASISSVLTPGRNLSSASRRFAGFVRVARHWLTRSGSSKRAASSAFARISLRELSGVTPSTKKGFSRNKVMIGLDSGTFLFYGKDSILSEI